MKKKITVVAIFSLLLLGFSPLSHGAGFLIYEHGAAAMAMGGAFVAVANNPTAIFHNPAGIAWLDGTQISVGTTLIFPKASLSLANWPDPTYQSVDQESQVFFPPTFYISHKISDRVVAGFGFFTPYGLGTKWPNDETFPLRYIATEDDMKTFFFNPAVAFKLNDNLSLGVGVSYIRSTLDFKLTQLLVFSLLPFIAFDVPATLDAKGSGWGLNAGALYKGEKFSLGFNWRGGFDIDYEGDVDLDLSNIPGAPLSSLSGTASTTFSLPHIFGVGVAFNLTEQLTITADVHYVLWSSFDEFEVDVEVPGIEAIYAGDLDQVVEEDWKDSFVLRGGLEYWVNEDFALRFGALYDQTPQPARTMDPILPDANRFALTGGIGYKKGSFVIDIAYQLELFADRTSPNRDIAIYQQGGLNLGEGTYSTTAHLIGVSIGYVF